MGAGIQVRYTVAYPLGNKFAWTCAEAKQELILLATATGGLAIYLIWRLREPARRLGLVDYPGGRKTHHGAPAVVGGIGIFASFALALLLLDRGLGEYRALFAGMTLLLVAGLLDGLRDLRSREKLVIQLAAALLMVFWGDRLVPHLGTVPGAGAVELGWLAVPFTVVCVVGLINSVNMIDGVDGVAGGVALAILFWLIVLAGATQRHEALAFPVLLAGSVAGFLLFNVRAPGAAALLCSSVIPAAQCSDSRSAGSRSM